VPRIIEGSDGRQHGRLARLLFRLLFLKIADLLFERGLLLGELHIVVGRNRRDTLRLERLYQLADGLRELVFQAILLGLELLAQSREIALNLLDRLRDLVGLGDRLPHLGELGVVCGEERRIVLRRMRLDAVEIFLGPLDRALKPSKPGLDVLVHARAELEVFVELDLLLKLILHVVLVELRQAEFDILQLVVGEPLFLGIAVDREEGLDRRFERAALRRDRLADIDEALADEFFDKVLTEPLARRRQVLLAEIERLADDGFADGDTRLRLPADIDIRRMPDDAADLELGAVAVSGLDDDLSSALEDVGQQLFLVVAVLGLVAEGNAEGVPEALEDRGLAAALNADQAVEMRREGHADAVEHAALETNGIEARVSDFGRLLGHTERKIGQRELDRAKG
jgi:hypothetical protein